MLSDNLRYFPFVRGDNVRGDNVRFPCSHRDRQPWQRSYGNCSVVADHFRCIYLESSALHSHCWFNAQVAFLHVCVGCTAQP